MPAFHPGHGGHRVIPRHHADGFYLVHIAPLSLLLLIALVSLLLCLFYPRLRRRPKKSKTDDTMYVDVEGGLSTESYNNYYATNAPYDTSPKSKSLDNCDVVYRRGRGNSVSQAHLRDDHLQQQQQQQQFVPPPTNGYYSTRQGPPQPPPMPLPLTPPPVPVSPARPPAHDFVISYSSLVLGAQIGGGGFGSVYKADYHGTPVAVKLLHNAAQSSQSDSIISEFRSEVAILSRLRHPNICLFMGADFTPPNRCIVTELATRGSLWDGLRTPLSPPHAECDGVSWNAWPHTQSVNNGGGAPPRGTWPFALVKSVCVGTVRGMLYLHGYGGAVGSGILHRDLKSANLLLDDYYNVKICDFGLARLKEITNDHTGNTGTVQWMAPEVLGSQRYNEKADVYSFGVIMWELLTRECPFEGLGQVQVAMKVLNERTSVAVPEWCGLGLPTLAGLVKACTAHEPERRPSFEMVLQQLEQL